MEVHEGQLLKKKKKKTLKMESSSLFFDLQNKKRSQLLESQKKRRQDLVNALRDIDEAPYDMEIQQESTASDQQTELIRNKKTFRRRRRCTSQQHEWMAVVPQDLKENWFVCARPEGVRCLVFSQNGKTYSRVCSSNCTLHSSFQSILPNGNHICQGKVDGKKTILDCIYQEETKTYFVIDLLCWQDYEIVDCESQFRFTFLTTKFMELSSQSQTSPFSPISTSEINWFNFSLVKYHSLHVMNPILFDSTVYRQKQYIQDGLLFVHKESHYFITESTPLVLIWKDPINCRFFNHYYQVHNNGSFTIALDLECIEGGIKLKSCDDITFDFTPLSSKQIQDEEIYKCKIGFKKDETSQTYNFCGIDVTSKCKSKLSPDPSSKLYFFCQYLTSNSIGVEQIMKKL